MKENKLLERMYVEAYTGYMYHIYVILSPPTFLINIKDKVDFQLIYLTCHVKLKLKLFEILKLNMIVSRRKQSMEGSCCVAILN